MGGGYVCVHACMCGVSGPDAVEQNLQEAGTTKFSTVSMKLGGSSEQEERCHHARFSQKHRYLSKEDLEVPLSNQDLQSTSLSWDNHLHTLSKKLSTSHLVFILHSCRPRCLLLWNCPVVTATEESTLFQFLSLFKTSFQFPGQHLTRASKRGRKSA